MARANSKRTYDKISPVKDAERGSGHGAGTSLAGASTDPGGIALPAPLSQFDSEVAEAWRRCPPPDVSNADVALARAVEGEYFQRLVDARPAPADISTEEVLVPSLVDDHEIPARIYRPTRRVNERGFAYFHGGGFVLGDLQLEEDKCFTAASGAGCVVVSVDYRLAPEHPYPTPLEDCYSVLRWMADHARELSIDPRRLGVGGCSAGGALAASVAQLCRDRGGPRLAMQMLLYPVLDASLRGDSLRTFGEEEALRDVERMWEYYLGAPRAETPGYASPAACEHLGGLAPAYIACAELDGFRDEAIVYAQRLLSAGVSVELHLWPRVPHAFELIAPTAAISRRSSGQQAEAIARLLDAAAGDR